MDIEPTSRTEEGYRGGAGWGFTYQNLTRALIKIYKGEDKASTVLAVALPEPHQKLTGMGANVDWATAGRAPAGYTILLDGHVYVHGVRDTHCSVSLLHVSFGAHTLTVVAEGATTRYEYGGA